MLLRRQVNRAEPSYIVLSLVVPVAPASLKQFVDHRAEEMLIYSSPM
jgi:hypothetical protein